MMKTFFTLYTKEVKSYINSLISYIFATIFLIILGSQFWDLAFLSGQTTMRPFFEVMSMLFIVFVPALTMKMWSEERRLGLDEILITAPIKPFGIIMAKFLGLFSFILILITTTLVFPYILSSIGELDWGPVIGSYIGVLFLVTTMIAIGGFFSIMTKNQIVSFLLSVCVIAALYTIGTDLIVSATGLFAEILQAVSIKIHFDRFETVLFLSMYVYAYLW
jgi:ABC-2 type transport system permease protein